MSIVTKDIACTLCGCVCDDLSVTVEQGTVCSTTGACFAAEPWFLKQNSSSYSPAYREGHESNFEEALSTAVEIIRSSKSPLIYGLSRSSTPGQRAAVQLADRIGATIDTTASSCHAPSIMSVQSVGESTSSLGEVKNRSDLIIYWGSNPLQSHPRHMERLVSASSPFIPDGRKGRFVVVVDVEHTETSKNADLFLKIEPSQDFEVISALRAIIKGVPYSEERLGGVSVEQVRLLSSKMLNCQYGGPLFWTRFNPKIAGTPHDFKFIMFGE